MGDLGPLLGPMFAVLGRLGAYVRDPWPSLGPLFSAMLAVLGRSWGLCWGSWPLLGHLLAVLGRLGLKNVEEYY